MSANKKWLIQLTLEEQKAKYLDERISSFKTQVVFLRNILTRENYVTPTAPETVEEAETCFEDSFFPQDWSFKDWCIDNICDDLNFLDYPSSADAVAAAMDAEDYEGLDEDEIDVMQAIEGTGPYSRRSVCSKKYAYAEALLAFAEAYPEHPAIEVVHSQIIELSYTVSNAKLTEKATALLQATRDQLLKQAKDTDEKIERLKTISAPSVIPASKEKTNQLTPGFSTKDDGLPF